MMAKVNDNPRPINVRLMPSEIASAERMAKVRYNMSRAMGIPDLLHDKTRHGSEADLPGLKAEIAVAKLLDIPSNISELGPDNGIDMYISNANTELGVQVKSTHCPGAKYVLTAKHGNNNWDLLIFVRPTDKADVMQVYGWLDAENFQTAVQPAPEVSKTPPLPHGVPVRFLRNMEELWRGLKSREYA
jgi:hypothetical protein